MSELAELEEERREKVEGILGMAVREGWCSLGDCVFCAVHAPEGAEPVKVADYEDTITDVVDASYLTLECEHEDGCDCMGEWDLPTVPEPEEDWRY